MTLSGLLHWLTSQSIFLARVDISDPFGRDTPEPISTVGYSCIGIIFVLMLGIFALLTATGMGYKSFAAEVTTAGSCSAAIFGRLPYFRGRLRRNRREGAAVGGCGDCTRSGGETFDVFE